MGLPGHQEVPPTEVLQEEFLRWRILIFFSLLVIPSDFFQEVENVRFSHFSIDRFLKPEQCFDRSFISFGTVTADWF